MSQIEGIKKLFKEIKKGNYGLRDEFFETIWVNSTRLAHYDDVNSLLKEMNDWANAHSETHPDFFEYMNLTLGFLEFLGDNFDSALKHLNKAHELFSDRKDEDGVAACCIWLGFLHRSTGEIDLALKFGLQGIEQLMQTGNYKMFLIIGCYWVGGVYADTGHLDEALRLFKDGLKVNHPKGIQSMGARLTNGIAGVYMKQKNFTLALENYQKSLDSFNTDTEATFRARGLTDLGDYYSKMGNYGLAIQYNREALAIRQEMKIQNGSITNLMNLGQLYFKQGNLNDSINTLTEALELAHEIKLKVKIYPIHRLLSDIYLEKGHIEESLAQYKLFHTIKEEVNYEDMERKVKNQVKVFKAEQTEKENAIIKAQKIEIEAEKKRSDELLHNILPEEVADELKAKGSADAKQFDSVSVLFTDFKDFTQISEKMTPTELVHELNLFFKAFDNIVTQFNIEKIKTIGDSYMCAGGLPRVSKTHAVDIANAALEIQSFVEQHSKERLAMGKEPLQIRIGIHSGPVIAGIVGVKKYAYDIWGDTVNTASRMESSGQAGKVNMSSNTYELLKDHFICTPRGKVIAKHKGEMEMYFLEGRI